MNKDVMKMMGFGREVELVEDHRCPFCAEKIGTFRANSHGVSIKSPVSVRSAKTRYSKSRKNEP